ncbi:MAG TPA: carboxypeptidase-like regulatory domain-containing protein [Bryobacteraceae bacterium]|nr:carboxypeptidase-like regulatory domain-containing protein [Bryobacteraceae bacterium]
MFGKDILSRLGVAVLFIATTTEFPAPVQAQSATTGLISGVVTDSSGAVLPGADVTLEQIGTNSVTKTVADAQGYYVFPAVSPSDYRLSFYARGFEMVVVSDIKVEVLKSYTQNAQLKVGSTQTTLTVTEAPTAELQTTSATVGQVLGGKALEELPVFTRSASALMFYQPAVSPSGQIAGARDEQVTFNLDGGDITSDLEGNNSYAAPPGEPSPSPTVPVPIESTQEFQVATTNPNAEFGRSSGGQVALLTKRGTNTFHGSLYEYHNDDGLNANGWTNNFNHLHKPHSVDNRFGGSVGGPIWKNRVWFFTNYEGRQFYDDTLFNAVVPTASMRAGVLKFRDAAGNVDSYSFLPGSITTACGGSSCDPRNLGFNSVVKSQLALYPAGNNTTLGDGLNTAGYTFNAPTPIKQNLGVLRLDGSINDKWRAFATYHYAKTDRVGTEQFSILGTPGSTATDPILPYVYTFELTGQITPNFTSVTHASYLRDWWGWNRLPPSPLVAGTQQALVLAGEGSGTSNSTSKLLADPVNLATQSARGRIFDGHKWYFGQDFSLLKGKHLLQFGASGYMNNDYFEKTDNFAGGLTAGPLLYSESTGNGSGEYLTVSGAYEPTPCGGAVTTNCLRSTDLLRWNELYTTMLGLVDRSSQVITRNGSFQPNPLGTAAFSRTGINSVNSFIQDVWQAKPGLSITLGLNWGAQPSPTEADGKYDVLVYAASNTPVDYWGYLSQRANSLNNGVAQGQAFNPLFGVTPVNYLPSPYTGTLRTTNWHQFAPRVSVAWQVPYHNWFFGDKKTVIRGGYAMIYDRMSDVNQVSLPLTTGGLLDVDACGGPVLTGGQVNCTNAATTPVNGFRIGTDGNIVPIPAPTTEPIPYVASGTAAAPFGLFMQSGLDPFAIPGHDHSIDLTIQRELPGRAVLEVGYIGRFSRNLPQDIAFNSSDYLMKDKLSGQTYAQAFDAVAVALRNGVATNAVPSQPFFDNQIGLSKCQAAGFPNCSAMVAKQDATDLVNGSINSFSLDEFDKVTPVPVDNIQSFQSYGITDKGFSNYNAGFVSIVKSLSNGLQFQANWTWSHAIGNQGVDQQSGSSANSPFNLNLDKSSEPFDRQHVVNLWWYYQLPFGRAHRLTNPVLARVIGGWSASGIFTFFTGTPMHIAADGDYGAYESNGTAAICSSNLLGLEGENAGVAGANNIGTSGNPATGGSGLNLFGNPAAVFNSCSRPLLSVNGQIPFDELRALPRWNVDFSAIKQVRITERQSFEFSAQFLNLFNVVNFNNPSLNLNSPTNFGVFTSQANNPRRVLLGLRYLF